MDTANILVAVIILCGVWNVVTTLIIYSELVKKGIALSYLWLRLMAPFYVIRYKELTIREKGRAGALFYSWIVSLNVVAVTVIVLVAIAL